MTSSEATAGKDPPQSEVQVLVNLFSQGQFSDVLSLAEELLRDYSISAQLHNIKGAAHAKLGQLDRALESFEEALKYLPNYLQL